MLLLSFSKLLIMHITIHKKITAAVLVLSSILMLQSFSEAGQDDPEAPKNLKVLPKNISQEELFSIMKGYSAALGVKCVECHAGTPTADGKMDFDFASDAKAEKEIARQMIRMVSAINGKYLKKIGGGQFEQISCVTCHRGSLKPMVSVDSLVKKTSR
jgi:hypothetical protein